MIVERQLLPGNETPEFTNPLDAIKYLVETIHSLSQEVSDIHTEMAFRKYTVTDLARMLECSAGTLRNNPWKLPLYGNPEIGTHPGGWLHGTCIAWYKIPEATRKDRWERMSSIERRTVQGSILEELQRKVS